MRKFLSTLGFIRGSEKGSNRIGSAKGQAVREIRERVSPASGWFYSVQRTLYQGKTTYQNIELVDTTEFGRTLLLDGATQVMEANEFQYHEPMAHIPLLCHPKPEKVLIIGGGDGGVLREVLKHPTVTQADLVELDEAVITFSRTMLEYCSQGAFEDPHTRIHIQDGRSFVEATTENYDVIIMDMTDPAGPSLRLYSREFFLALSRIFRDKKSRFIMHSESPDCRPQAFARIHRTLRSVFPSVMLATTCIRMYGGLWSFAMTSMSRGNPSPQELSVEEIRQRMQERKLSKLKVISPETWQAFFAPYPYIFIPPEPPDAAYPLGVLENRESIKGAEIKAD